MMMVIFLLIIRERTDIAFKISTKILNASDKRITSAGNKNDQALISRK